MANNKYNVRCNKCGKFIPEMDLVFEQAVDRDGGTFCRKHNTLRKPLWPTVMYKLIKFYKKCYE